MTSVVSKITKRHIRSIIIGTLLGMTLGGTFIAGFLLRDAIDITGGGIVSAAGDDVGYPLLDEVQRILDSVYLREQAAYTERQYAAVRGMLTTLEDPNTFFIDPPVARSEADTLAGTYGGIGVLLQRNEAGEFILYPFSESPAAAAGVQDGAVLLAINGEPITLDSQQDAVDQQMRGEVREENGVEITVRQSDSEETLFIAFDVINVPSVIWRVLEENDQVGYVQILRFTGRTPTELETALQDLDEAGTIALILDLRNNSGGLLEESITVASQFLDGGIVTYEVSQTAEQAHAASEGGLATEQPIVVLVNRRTASASELVAGAIRDRDRGILIGQTTFGKGTVQQIFTLSDGSSVHVTSSEWFTPNRTPLSGIGLTPNIEMIPDENGRDVELGEAIRYLQDNVVQG